jgi:hypothetical protein
VILEAGHPWLLGAIVFVWVAGIFALLVIADWRRW